jgi:ligand-binding sensor domain-containing protein
MVQDKDGFMWFGTETGLSRFDGTHFKNFYTSDGLPDNEIIKLFIDSKNRVWIFPFRNSIAYYLNGRIHNQQNDSLLKKIKITSDLTSVVENKSGDILIQETFASHIIRQDGEIVTLKILDKDSVWAIKAGLNNANGFRLAISVLHKGFNFADINQDKLIVKGNSSQRAMNNYGTIGIRPGIQIFSDDKDSLSLVYHKDNLRHKIFLPKGFIGLSEINDSCITLNTLDSVLLFNINQKKVAAVFLRGHTVNTVKEDTEGNFWFSVFGKGIYRLGSTGVINYFFETYNNNSAVYSIEKSDSILYIGTDHFFLWTIDAKRKNMHRKKIDEGATQGRVTAILANGKDSLIIGTDRNLLQLIKGKVKAAAFKQGLVSIKAVFENNKGELIISTNISLYRVRIKDFKVIENTIWLGRSTCSYEKNDSIYMGTINGLYRIDKMRKAVFLGNSNRLLESRIAAIAEYRDGTLWIATSGNGLVGYKNGEVTANITVQNGLTSNICRNIFVSDSNIWVGTDKGLNKITFSDTGLRVINYTSADGLKSDIINAIEVDGREVWVGTPEGLTYFDENEISKRSDCRLLITDIAVSDKKWLFDTSNFTLLHKDNNIKFDFVGISYKSAGDIIYNYKLSGLDTAWKTTRETFLSYPSLPSGQYQLKLFAVNKFGVKSNQLQIQFTVEKLLWEKLWFQLLVLLFAIGLAWIIVYLRIKNLKKSAEQKMVLTRRVGELEQMALKSQMNPHFIFNSLNSIQQYVIDKDIVGANEFITQFSRLIRLTLDISSKLSISLAEEITYISTYLELEKKRFENKFVYDIVVSGNIDTENHFIPPMILQPYIENAVRHGMRYKKDADGKILISVNKNDQHLICSIEDNGIGRKQAGKFKSSMAVEYQSKGMTLTAKRIEVFNKTHAAPVLIDIKDLENDEQEPKGTKIAIYFPLRET